MRLGVGVMKMVSGVSRECKYLYIKSGQYVGGGALFILIEGCSMVF